MPFKVQRVPRGLHELLSLTGGETPRELEDRVRCNLELLQFFALQQRQNFSANDPALTEGNHVSNTPEPSRWIVLFSMSGTVIKTATMTALRIALALRYNGSATQEEGVMSEELGPFGATESGAVSVIWQCPYPRILPPATQFLTRLQILGTDANASVTIGCHYGVLG